MKFSLYLPLAVLLVAACSKSSTDQNVSTLATGVVVTKLEACNATESTQRMAIEKTSDGYSVSAVAALQCESEKPTPFLTTTIDRKATLVLGREAMKSTSGCECFQRLQVSIQGRLESGDTLYLLNDYVVVGHALVP